ncbi:MAG: hypothetical protein HDR05_12600 [Lachnospiraceae bacterium]|nr:hypothetical protein [Lachnospiraceae bacterium]
MKKQKTLQLNTYQIIVIFLVCLIFMDISTIRPKAESLENIINVEQHTEQSNEISNSDYIEYMKDATNLSEPSQAASKINDFTSKIASFIINVVAYFITAFLAVRVLMNLCYVAIPFTRSILSNGYQGNAQANGNPMGQQNGVGGAGQLGMNNGGMYNNMNMQGQGQGQVTPASGRMQLISSEALNAVAAEAVMNPNGKPNSAIKVYAKSTVNILVLTSLLIVLAISGALTNLGFLLGEIISRGISSIGNML